MAKIHSNDRGFVSAQFRRMSDEQCQKIHWASLEVMERTGVRLYEQEAIDLMPQDVIRAVHAIVERAEVQYGKD